MLVKFVGNLQISHVLSVRRLPIVAESVEHQIILFTGNHALAFSSRMLLRHSLETFRTEYLVLRTFRKGQISLLIRLILKNTMMYRFYGGDLDRDFQSERKYNWNLSVYHLQLYCTSIRDRDFKIKGTVKFSAALVSHYKTLIQFDI